MEIFREIEEKTERLTAMMKAERLGGILINSQANFAWLTGGAQNGVDSSRDNGVGSLLVRNDGKRFLLANRIEMPRMLAEEVSEHHFEPLDFGWADEKADPQTVLKTAQSLLGKGSKLATDLFFDPNFRVVEGLIAPCRYRLTENEIVRFESLAQDAGQVLGRIHQKISVGQTEEEIARIVHAELGQCGINSIVTLVAADERITRFRHPVPTGKVWNKLLMVVVCAKRDGLIASLSRIFCVGPIPSDLRKKTAATARVHARAIHQTRPENFAGDIFATIKKEYAENGFAGEELKHHQGGACGYRTRDWVAHPASKEQVMANQAFAWNPTITGAKSEEALLVTDEGARIISASPDFPHIINIIEGIEYRTPDILSL